MRRLGKYVLLAEIGEGKTSHVYVAGTAATSRTLVAIKCLRPALAEDPEFVARLVDEARIASRLHHPNVVHTLEIGDDAGQFFLVMEYLQGQMLRRMQSGEHQLPVRGQIAVLARALDGLEHAHNMKDYDGTPLMLVHRDVTPANVFVTYDGVVKVLGFGIARAVGRVAETRVGFIKEAPAYMAPETARREQLDRRADLFSAGVILWEALTGRRMWGDLSDTEVLTLLARNEVLVSPRAVDPDVPEALDAICRRALAPARDERFTTAAEMASALVEWLNAYGPPMTQEELGAFVARSFAQQRAKTAAVLEAQLAKVTHAVDEGSSTELPVESARRRSHADVTSAAFDQSGSRSTDAVPDASIGPTLPSPTVRSRGRSGSAWRGLVPPLVGLGLAGMIGGVAMLVYVEWAGRRAAATASKGSTAPSARGDDASAVVVASASASSSAGIAQASLVEDAASPAPARTVRVSLRAQPASAKFRIDGGPMLENPYVAELPADEKPHVVVVEAPSYLSLAQQVVLSDDLTVQISLAHQPKAPPRRGPAKRRPHR